MASQLFDITSNATSSAIDPNAIFTIRRYLWKNEKMCSFVRRCAPHFYEFLQRPGPCETQGYSPGESKYSWLFPIKPEVFLAEALEAQSHCDERRIAVLTNKIFLSLNTPALKELEERDSSNVQDLLSELLNALHIEPTGLEDGLLQQLFITVGSGALSSLFNTCSMRDLLAQLQQAKALKRNRHAEQFSEAIFSRLKSESSIDPLFEKDLLEVLYGPPILRACSATAHKDVFLSVENTCTRAPQDDSSAT